MNRPGFATLRIPESDFLDLVKLLKEHAPDMPLAREIAKAAQEARDQRPRSTKEKRHMKKNHDRNHMAELEALNRAFYCFRDAVQQLAIHRSAVDNIGYTQAVHEMRDWLEGVYSVMQDVDMMERDVQQLLQAENEPEQEPQARH